MVRYNTDKMYNIKKCIEELILDQQDDADFKGLLVPEIKLGLFQKYELEIHSNRIHRILAHNIPGVKKTSMHDNGMPPYIYRIRR